MSTAEMHELLMHSFAFVRSQTLFLPGTTPGLAHIKYCRFCNYSETHTAEHGHSGDCLYAALERAVATNPHGT
jgi:hypothetical protein